MSVERNVVYVICHTDAGLFVGHSKKSVIDFILRFVMISKSRASNTKWDGVLSTSKERMRQGHVLRCQ